MIRLIVILLLLLPAGVFGQATQFVGPLKGLVDAGAGGTAVPDAADIFARGLTFTAPETYTVGATGDFATLEEALTYSRAFTAVYSGAINQLTLVDGFATFNFEIQDGSYTWPADWRVNGIHLLLYAQNAGQVTITHQCAGFGPALTVDGGGHVVLKDLILDGSGCGIAVYRVDNGKLSLLESELTGDTGGSIPFEDFGIAVLGGGLAYLRNSSVSAATGIYMEEFGQVRIEQSTGADTISGTQAAIRAVERANLSAELVNGTLTLSGGADGVVASEAAVLLFEAAGGTLEFAGAGGGVAVSDSSRVWIPSATQFNQTGPDTNVTLNLVTSGGAFVSTGVISWDSGNVFEGSTPTNYTAATDDVAAHLAGIDTALDPLVLEPLLEAVLDLGQLQGALESDLQLPNTIFLPFTTADELRSNGANCSAGFAPIGVNAVGAAEGCFDVWTEAENTAANYLPAADLRDVIWAAVSDETSDLTTGTASLTLYLPNGFTIDTTIEDGVGCSLNTAPTGSAVTVDINEAGASILTTRVTIDVGTNTSKAAAAAPVVSDTSLASGAALTFDIDIVGSSTAGAGLKCWLIGAWQ